MFRATYYYRHDCTLDIDLEVIKVRYVGPQYVRLKVNIVNREHTGYFERNVNVKISRYEFNRWRMV